MSIDVSPDGTEVNVSVWFDVNVQQAFDAWIDPTKIGQWFGPVDYRAEVLEMDVRIDGKWRFKMISKFGKISHHRGRYVAIEPNTFLSFTWESEEDKELTGGRETLVSVSFSNESGGVRITLHHQKLPNRNSVEALEFGWSSGLKKLVGFFQDRNTSKQAS